MWYVFAFNFRWGDATDTTVATKAEAGRDGPVWLLLHGGVSFHLLVSQPCLDFWKCVLCFVDFFFSPFFSFCYCIHTTHHHRSKAKVRHLRCSRLCLLTHLRKQMHGGGCMCESAWEKHENTFLEPRVYGHKVIFQIEEWVMGGAGVGTKEGPEDDTKSILWGATILVGRRGMLRRRIIAPSGSWVTKQHSLVQVLMCDGIIMRAFTLKAARSLLNLTQSADFTV